MLFQTRAIKKKKFKNNIFDMEYHFAKNVYGVPSVKKPFQEYLVESTENSSVLIKKIECMQFTYSFIYAL